jgi:hypothetical protein
VQANNTLAFDQHHGWHIIEPGNDGPMDYILMEKSH